MKVPIRRNDETRLQSLREAAEVGIADIEAGRYRTFETPESLRNHLSQLAEDAITDSAAGRSTNYE